MAFTFQCPKCKVSLEGNDELAGAQLACPNCGEMIDVPSPQPEPQLKVASASANLIKCIACGKEISPNASSCPHCGNPIEHKKPTRWYHWLFVAFGILVMLIGGTIFLISQGQAKPAIIGTIFVIIGVFISVAPFCRRRNC